MAHRNRWFTYWKWWFSTAMLNNQRVRPFFVLIRFPFSVTVRAPWDDCLVKNCVNRCWGSFFEIYNEIIFDLFNPCADRSKLGAGLQVKEHPVLGHLDQRNSPDVGLAHSFWSQSLVWENMSPWAKLYNDRSSIIHLSIHLSTYLSWCNQCLITISRFVFALCSFLGLRNVPKEFMLRTCRRSWPAMLKSWCSWCTAAPRIERWARPWWIQPPGARPGCAAVFAVFFLRILVIFHSRCSNKGGENMGKT